MARLADRIIEWGLLQIMHYPSWYLEWALPEIFFGGEPPPEASF